MIETFTHLLGATMSVISFVLWLPQAKLVWSNRNNPLALQSISLITQVLVLFNAVGWGVYGFLTEAFWVGAPGLVNGPLALLIIFLVLRVRKVEAVDSANNVQDAVA